MYTHSSLVACPVFSQTAPCHNTVCNSRAQLRALFGPTARALDKLCVVTSHDPLPKAGMHIVDDYASVPSE